MDSAHARHGLISFSKINQESSNPLEIWGNPSIINQEEEEEESRQDNKTSVVCSERFLGLG